MAASSTQQQMETRDFNDRMTPFPCMFNMPCFDHPIRSRLRDRKGQLLQMLEEGLDTREEEKKVQNTLTWIFYQLGLKDRAAELNERVLIDTGYECIVALGNFVYMAYLRRGQISEQFRLLDGMKEKSEFGEKVLIAKAEQAFCLGKLGNMYNLMSAVKLYEENLMSMENEVWLYLLGLTYRRLAVMHGVEKYSNNKLSQDICYQKAKECFLKISESPDNRLKALGLANIAANYLTSRSEMLARVDIAVRTDSSNSEVYLVCGRPLIYDDPMRAVPLLEKAVKLRPQRSVSHHQLGKAYVQEMYVRRQNTREMQDKAQRHLRQAYETSAKLNIAPLLDLARLFQRMRKMDMAQKEALTLLTSRFAGQSAIIPTQNTHIFLFYLGTSDAQRHLLLSLLASIALVREEASENQLHAVWSHLFERDQRHADVTDLKKSAEVLCKNFEKNRSAIGRVPTSIAKFVRDGRIDDVAAVGSEARELLRACTNEEALLFVELVSLRPRMEMFPLRDLHLQLLLTQANGCLEDHLSIGSLFFRKAFDMSFSVGEGLQEDSMENESNVPIIKIDMIMLFNDSVKNSSTLCSSTAYGLEDAMSTLFGLKVAFNPILNTAEDGEEMKVFADKHLVDVIVVVFEGDGSETQYLLEKIGPFIGKAEHTEDENQRPLVVLIQCQEQPALYLPEELKRLPCLSLGQPGDAFPNLFSLQEAQEEADKSWDIRGVLQSYFEGNTRNVVKLFRHLTGQRD